MEVVCKDPVCGMDVKPSSSLRLLHEQREYLFCAPCCLEKFRADPARYLTSSSLEPKAAPSSAPAPRRLARYAPLLMLLGATLLAASARQLPEGQSTWTSWMQDFMGFFLFVFALLKLFDLAGFARGFARYDLLASRSRLYALSYPFLELALALAYLARWQPSVTYLATIALMTFGACGVLRSLRKGQDLRCACMGSVLDVPLSTVALLENLGMAAMALMALLMKGGG